jgi:hypothetical protein
MGVYHLFIDFKEVYDLVRGSIMLCSFRIFGTCELFRLIKICLIEMSNKARTTKNLSADLPIQNCLK